MDIKFNSIDNGRFEITQYQNAISAANSIITDLGLMSKMFLSWSAHIRYEPNKHNNVVEIALYHHDGSTPFYFLIKADIDMGQLTVHIQHTDMCFSEKTVLTNNLFMIADCDFVKYIENVYETHINKTVK